MKKICILVFTVLTLAGKSQVLTYSATPDSANQTPRSGSTGTFNIAYSGSVCTNEFMYSICCANSISSALNLYRFNINVPPSASITGVSATYSTSGGNGGPTNYKWDSLSLSNNFTTIGTYKRDSINGAGGTFSHGGPADLWGTALTPSVVNSPYFGLKFHIDTYGVNTTILGAFVLTIHYTLPTGIAEKGISASEPSIYNFDGKLYVSGNSQPDSKLIIYSVSGKKMSETSIESDSKIISLSGLNSGVYFYSFKNNLQQKHAKIIIE